MERGPPGPPGARSAPERDADVAEVRDDSLRDPHGRLDLVRVRRASPQFRGGARSPYELVISHNRGVSGAAPPGYRNHRSEVTPSRETRAGIGPGAAGRAVAGGRAGHPENGGVSWVTSAAE